MHHLPLEINWSTRYKYKENETELIPYIGSTSEGRSLDYEWKKEDCGGERAINIWTWVVLQHMLFLHTGALATT